MNKLIVLNIIILGPLVFFSSFRTVKYTAFQQIAGVQLHEHRNVPVVLLRYYLTV